MQETEMLTVLFNCEHPDDGPVKPETCGSWCIKMLL